MSSDLDSLNISKINTVTLDTITDQHADTSTSNTVFIIVLILCILAVVGCVIFISVHKSEPVNCPEQAEKVCPEQVEKVCPKQEECKACPK